MILYAPHYPDINVCNTELDWGSIMSGFTKLKLEADYQVSQWGRSHDGADALDNPVPTTLRTAVLLHYDDSN